MALPMPGNTTAVVYRSGNAPPNDPDSDLGRVSISDNFQNLERGESMNMNVRYTHVMHCDLSVDVRDGRSEDYDALSGADTVYVPNKNGQSFRVTMVVKNGYLNFRTVYLLREGWNNETKGGSLSVQGEAGGVLTECYPIYRIPKTLNVDLVLVDDLGNPPGLGNCEASWSITFLEDSDPEIGLIWLGSSGGLQKTATFGCTNGEWGVSLKTTLGQTDKLFTPTIVNVNFNPLLLIAEVMIPVGCGFGVDDSLINLYQIRVSE
ncbi:MAG: hypothetical protein ACFCD0_23895 [Gemmataceae bacterium]